MKNYYITINKSHKGATRIQNRKLSIMADFSDALRQSKSAALIEAAETW